MSGETEPRILFSVVLSDANIIYSRVLRDYVLYAMAHQLLRVLWSAEILDEATEHLIDNGVLDEAGAGRLVTAMNRTFPYSQIEVTEAATAAVADFKLVDEDDRHVIAAAVAAEAPFLCSDDRTGFPPEVMTALGIEVVTTDALLSALIEEAPAAMVGVHRTVVSRMKGATDESTLVALRRAKAVRAADLMAAMISGG